MYLESTINLVTIEPAWLLVLCQPLCIAIGFNVQSLLGLLSENKDSFGAIATSKIQSRGLPEAVHKKDELLF